MNRLLRFFLGVFVTVNIISFSLVMYKKPKKCAKTLKNPFEFARMTTDTRLSYYFLGSLLSTIYVGTYIALYLNEKPGQCGWFFMILIVEILVFYSLITMIFYLRIEKYQLTKKRKELLNKIKEIKQKHKEDLVDKEKIHKAWENKYKELLYGRI